MARFAKNYLTEESSREEEIVMSSALFIRLLEYAKEDARSDLDLHRVAERVADITRDRHIARIADYQKIVR